MKTTLFKSAILFLAIFVGLSSCKKDDPDSPKSAFAAPKPAIPEFDDADAVLIAVKSITPFGVKMPVEIPGMPANSMTTEIEMGMGIAVFKNKAKAESVKLNGHNLPFVKDIHIWQPDHTSLLGNLTTGDAESIGIDFSKEVLWNVVNPDFSNEARARLTFTTTPEITTTSKTIDKSIDFTITNKRLGNAGVGTKILYAVYSEDGKSVLKEKENTSTSCTFTQNELSGLKTGKNAVIQVNAYKTDSRISNGKKFYLITQVSYSLVNIEIK